MGLQKANAARNDSDLIARRSRRDTKRYDMALTGTSGVSDTIDAHCFYAGLALPVATCASHSSSDFMMS